jgi:hypothetical protein
MEEIRILGALLFAEAPMWVVFCFGHYTAKKPGQRRTKAPGWLRKIFGDFRKEGELLTEFMVAQAIGYSVIIIALLIALIADLTRQYGVGLAILWLAMLFIVPVLIFEVVPRLSKRGQ